jgi:hypothetical protein
MYRGLRSPHGHLHWGTDYLEFPISTLFLRETIRPPPSRVNLMCSLGEPTHIVSPNRVVVFELEEAARVSRPAGGAYPLRDIAGGPQRTLVDSGQTPLIRDFPKPQVTGYPSAHDGRERVTGYSEVTHHYRFDARGKIDIRLLHDETVGRAPHERAAQRC